MGIDFKDSGKNKRFNDALIFGTAAYLLYKCRNQKTNRTGCSDYNASMEKQKRQPQMPEPNIFTLVSGGALLFGCIAGYIYLWVEKFIFCTGNFLFSVLFYFFTPTVVFGFILLFYWSLFGIDDTESNLSYKPIQYIFNTIILVLYIILFSVPAWYRARYPNPVNLYYSGLILIGYAGLIVYTICMPIKVLLYVKDKKNAQRKTDSSGKSF